MCEIQCKYSVNQGKYGDNKFATLQVKERERYYMIRHIA